MIKTVGDMKGILQNYDAKSWVKSADLTNEGFRIENTPKLPAQGGETQKSFGEFLTESVMKVNELQKNANTAVEKLATGKSKNLPETLLAVEQAEIAFKTMNQIRLKVIDAYKEVMKMQV